MGKTKTCRTCGQTKPLDQFPKTKESKDGRRRECLQCKRIYLRKWRRDPKNRERRKIYMQIWHKDPENRERQKTLREKRRRAQLQNQLIRLGKVIEQMKRAN